MEAPRVRFAPAPTGYLHVGSARSALFNWLFARHHGGKFILRIEDTNEEKKTQAFVDAIIDPLRWLGLDWDEGPYFQSQRRPAHDLAIEQLIGSGQAYVGDTNTSGGGATASGGEVAGGGAAGGGEVAGEVVRFRVPEGSTVINDLIRGRVEVAHTTIDDFVIRRSDGSPTFFLANAVDDHDMGITHVIRGEDLLNTTPKVKMLWEALGYGTTPTYAHLPLLVNHQRKKLSKRRDSVALAEFRQQGYLPTAMLNYLALLGWGPPDETEIRPLDEIVSLFSLESVNAASAFFDLTKLAHINATYIKAMSPSEFVEAASAWFPVNYDLRVVEALADEVQQRIVSLAQAPSWLDWLFVEKVVAYDAKAWHKTMVKGRAVERVLSELKTALAAVAFNDSDLLRATVLAVGDYLSTELGVRVMSQPPLRVALTGSAAGIPLWEAMTHLGKEQTLARINAAQAKLAG